MLFDTDGVFGTLLSANNPGYDREIVYETGNNGRIAIYKHELNNPGQLITSFDVDAYSQRSIAASLAGGNLDYFYDFFIPLSALDASGAVRMTATTVTSAGSGIMGTISDFNGIDDSKYGNNTVTLMNELTNVFPSIDLNNLISGFDASTWLMQSTAPAVNTDLSVSSTSITGTSKRVRWSKYYDI